LYPDGWATTGDLVKFDDDNLWIMGRKKEYDHQRRAEYLSS